MKVGIVAPFIFAAGIANATTIDFGMMNAAGDGFNHVQSYDVATTTSYADDYYFQTSTLMNLDGFLANWLVTTDGIDEVKSDNMTVDFSIWNTATTAWDNMQTWNVAVGGVINYNSIIDAGSYRLDIAGDVTGHNGSTYALEGNVSPVPEPSAIALMLGGVGLVGFMAARRRKNA